MPDEVYQEENDKQCFGLWNKRDSPAKKITKLICALPFIPFILIYFALEYLCKKAATCLEKSCGLHFHPAMRNL